MSRVPALDVALIEEILLYQAPGKTARSLCDFMLRQGVMTCTVMAGCDLDYYLTFEGFRVRG